MTSDEEKIFATEDTENTEVNIVNLWSSFYREYLLIAITCILFRLDGELLFFTCLKKSNQKKGHPGRSCFAYP